MKNKTNLLSSLLIALIAGFIYFQFGGVEDIKRIASLSFQIISKPIDDVTSSVYAKSGKLVYITHSNDEENSKVILYGNKYDSKKGLKDIAVVDSDGNIISISQDDLNKIEMSVYESSPMTIEGEITFNPEYYVPFSKHSNDVYLESIRVPDYQDYIVEADPLVDYYKATIPIEICNATPMKIMFTDSNIIKFNLKGLELKSTNLKLNVAMEKLNLALEKLSDNLRVMDFNFNDKENQKEFELNMKEFEADMKEFEQEMKEFGYDFEDDMEEFEQDMREYEEDMREYEEDMREYEEDMKEYERDMREYEQDMKEYEGDMKEYEHDMKEYEGDMEKSNSK